MSTAIQLAIDWRVCNDPKLRAHLSMSDFVADRYYTDRGNSAASMLAPVTGSTRDTAMANTESEPTHNLIKQISTRPLC